MFRARHTARFGVAAIGVLAMLAGTFVASAGASPQDTEPAPASTDEPVAPAGSGTAVFEGSFTLSQSEAAEKSGTATAPVPDHDTGALRQDENAPPSPEQQAREQAAESSSASASPAPSVPSDSSNAPPATFRTAFKGIDQEAGGCSPPDSDGAVGALHYVEIVNCRMRVYRKSDNAMVKNVTLASHFTDSDFVFDPRMVYDQTYKRWVGIVTRRADSGTDPNRYFKLAVTNASNGDASQGWLVYRVNFSGINGEWCDYPQLGIGQDEILVTCNNFDDANGGFERVIVMAIPKARAYNGWGFSFPIFAPAGAFSVAPPVLVGTPQQQNDNLYFVAADDGANQLDLYRMNNGAHPGQTTFVKQADIGIGTWSQPVDAFNCGGGGPTGAPTLVDALEGRIQQNGWQNDNSSSLWTVHSQFVDVDNDGFAESIKPKYFQINTTTNTIIRTGLINRYGAGIDEWNASLAVNGADQVFATWTASGTGSSPCLNVMRGGCEAGIDCDSNIGDTAIVNITSAGPINNVDGAGRNRWGDYSSVEPDPSNYGAGCSANKTAWASNEYVAENNGRWDNRIVHYGFC